jgi:hypothetical protein
MYREWAYTAMSRGREMNRMYRVAAPDRARDEIAPADRLTTSAGLLTSMRRRLGQSMALDANPSTEREARRTDVHRRTASDTGGREDDHLARWRWWRRRATEVAEPGDIACRTRDLDSPPRRLQFDPARVSTRSSASGRAASSRVPDGDERDLFSR